jgi:hypothetical protein
MKKYLIRGLMFAIPFVAYFLFIVIIDPHNFVNIFHVINDTDKKAIINRNDESSPRGNMLWKTLKIKRNQIKKIIIGDSQGAAINVDLIEKVSGEKYFNYCIPGASFETIFDMFWLAAGQTKLEKVYFTVAFVNYNSSRNYNIFHFAQDYLDKPYLYFITKENFFDSYVNLVYQITKNPKLTQNSYEYLPDAEMNGISMSRMNKFFEKYSYPKAYYSELNKIKQYCHENDIELKFLILPVYKGVDDYLEEHNLLEMNKRFKDDIKFLGDTYDLDVPGEFKNTREYYIDFFHLRHPKLEVLTRQIWGDQEYLQN